MSEDAAASGLAGSLFLRELGRLLRAEPAGAAGDPAALFAPYLVSPRKRRTIPILGDPGARTLALLEMYYNAVGLAAERATGRMVASVVRIHPEGFGRAVLVAGRLVAYSRHHRDLHRFGFESIEALADAGDACVAEAVALIERFPEVAAFEAPPRAAAARP